MINNPLDLVVFGILTCIVLFQMFDKWQTVDQLNKEKKELLEELSKAIKAVIAKNANEYVMTASIDKVPTETEEKDVEPDEVPIDTLSDDEFDQAIGIKRQPPKK